MKKCPRCKTEKAADDFNKRARSKDGLSVWCRACNKEWRNENREYSLARCKEWRENNSTRVKEYDKTYYEKIKLNPGYRSGKSAQAREWRSKNKEHCGRVYQQYRETNMESLRQKNKAWKENNKAAACSAVREWKVNNRHRVAAINAYRRAQKLRATPVWVDREKIAEFYYTADMLGMHTGDPYHVDHIIPLIHPLVCGLHVPANLQILEAKENISKGNKWEPA